MIRSLIYGRCLRCGGEWDAAKICMMCGSQYYVDVTANNTTDSGQLNQHVATRRPKQEEFRLWKNRLTGNF